MTTATTQLTASQHTRALHGVVAIGADAGLVSVLILAGEFVTYTKQARTGAGWDAELVATVKEASNLFDSATLINWLLDSGFTVR